MGRGWGKVLRGWGGDGNLKTSRGVGTGGVKVTYYGDGAGMGLIRLLRGGNGVKTLTPCHSLLMSIGHSWYFDDLNICSPSMLNWNESCLQDIDELTTGVINPQLY